MGAHHALLRIVRFGLIKVAPGLFNFALIPYLLVTLGSAAYGLYSVWLGYAMLVANTVAAIVCQPMFRHLSSKPHERDLYAGFAVAASLLALLLTVFVLAIAGVPKLLAAGFGAFALGTVLTSVVAVDFTISQNILRLAFLEVLRIVAILVVLAWPQSMGVALRIDHVVLAMALANLLPAILLAGRPSFARPHASWLRENLAYGAKSATWLVLAGLPIVTAKTLLMTAMTQPAFGSYTAVADLSYRGFAIVNAALMMWAFPLLSREYDAGNLTETRRLFRFTLLVYAVTGLIGLAAVMGGIGFLPIPVAQLPGGLAAVALITLTSIAWHGMSIAHKPYELTLRTTRMAGLMALCVAGFHALAFLLPPLTGLDAFAVVVPSMLAMAVVYMTIAGSQRLRGGA